jgi:hypothetical protein
MDTLQIAPDQLLFKLEEIASDLDITRDYREFFIRQAIVYIRGKEEKLKMGVLE